MGLAIDRDAFTPEDHERFASRLADNLVALRELLARPGFGEGPRTLGVELELSLVDAQARPLPRNLEVLAAARDARLTSEVDRFNLECNGTPVSLAGRPFSTLGRELAALLERVAAAAAGEGGRVALVGILPTLRESDLGPDALTDLPRYRALSAAIRRLRGRPFEVRIGGDEPLVARSDEVTFEGANTSFQIHLRVAPAEFAAVHAAAQIATAPALATAGNAPFFLGHRLWDETRIALFKQSVDERGELPEDWHPAARVGFGHGFVRSGAFELFAESVALHPPLLPVCSSEDALACVRAGGVPELGELRLHQGTVWRWNRAVYDAADGGHLRIELRALPSGPSLPDMLANAAFLVGLTLGLAPEIDALLPAMPFEYAHRNFYRAAQRGLDARLLWPANAAPSPRERDARALALDLLPVARRGLASAGVDAEEIDRHLGVVEARIAAGVTGARWQHAQVECLEKRLPRPAALAALVERMIEEARGGRPVHAWRPPS